MVEPRALRLGDLWIMCARTQVWHALEHNDADDAVDGPIARTACGRTSGIAGHLWLAQHDTLPRLGDVCACCVAKACEGC